jgi:hypothetical protein
LGYFIYDGILCLTVLKDYESAVHHALCALGQVGLIVSGSSAAAMSYFMFFAEYTTPLLHSFKMGFVKPGSLAHTLFQGLFAVLFLVGRGPIGVYFLYHLLIGHHHVWFKFSAIGVMCVSQIWIYRCLQAVAQVLGLTSSELEVKVDNPTNRKPVKID